MKILVNFIVFILTLSTALSIEPFKQIKTDGGKIHRARYSEDRKTFMIIQGSQVTFYNTDDWSVKKKITIPDSIYKFNSYPNDLFDVTTDGLNLIFVKKRIDFMGFDLRLHYSIPDFKLLQSFGLFYDDGEMWGTNSRMDVNSMQILNGDYMAVISSFDQHWGNNGYLSFKNSFNYNIYQLKENNGFSAGEIYGRNSNDNKYIGYSEKSNSSEPYRIDVFSNKGNLIWSNYKDNNFKICTIDSFDNLIAFYNNCKIKIYKDSKLKESKNLVEAVGYFYDTKSLGDVILIDELNLYVMKVLDTLLFVDAKSFYILDKYKDTSYIRNFFYDSSTKIITLTNNAGNIVFLKITKYTGISEKNSTLKEFSISPNPTTDFIEISIGTRRAVSDQSNIKIFNIYGQNCDLNPTTSSSGEGVRIDVSGLAPGMYFVRIGDKVSKFIKI